MEIETFADGTPYEEIVADQLVLGDVVLPWSGEIEVTGVWTVTALASVPNGIAFRADQVSHKLHLDLRNFADLDLTRPLDGGAIRAQSFMPTDKLRVYRAEGDF